MSRKVDLKNLQNCSGFEDIRITSDDFEHALAEIEPLFGRDSTAIDKCIEHGIIEYSPAFKNILHKSMKVVAQARSPEASPLLSLLLVGESGSGKSAMASHIARMADFPFIRRVANEDLAGSSEQEKVMRIPQIFDDAQKSPLSAIILDDLEHLMDFTCIGPRFSNSILQLFFGMLKRRPVKQGHRMLIIGTTSESDFIRTSKLMRAFNVTLGLPMLSDPSHFQEALRGLPAFTPQVLNDVYAALPRSIGIRMLLRVAEMVGHQHDSISIEAEHILECFRDCGAFDASPDL
jgi:vesicle-fusing ATPase